MLKENKFYLFVVILPTSDLDLYKDFTFWYIYAVFTDDIIYYLHVKKYLNIFTKYIMFFLNVYIDTHTHT